MPVPEHDANMKLFSKKKLRRPLVRWHGGKWRLAPWIIDHFPPHRVYVEPFGGGGSVLLRKSRAYAEVYNDLDKSIVNLFQIVRDHGPDLKARLGFTPFSRAVFNEALEISPDAEPMQRACALVVRSFMGFGTNGPTQVTGFRSNSNRSGTTPAHDWANYPEALSGIIERLKGVVIENRDAREVMATHDGPETLHYVDPPYLFSTRADNRHDYAFELEDSEHLELLEFLQTLQGMVVLSGYPSALYDKWKPADWVERLKATYADGAKKRTECLWLNAAAIARQRQGALL